MHIQKASEHDALVHAKPILIQGKATRFPPHALALLHVLRHRRHSAPSQLIHAYIIVPPLACGVLRRRRWTYALREHQNTYRPPSQQLSVIKSASPNLETITRVVFYRDVVILLL